MFLKIYNYEELFKISGLVFSGFSRMMSCAKMTKRCMDGESLIHPLKLTDAP